MPGGRKNHLNIATFCFCRQGESNLGCQRSKRAHYPLHHCWSEVVKIGISTPLYFLLNGVLEVSPSLWLIQLGGFLCGPRLIGFRVSWLIVSFAHPTFRPRRRSRKRSLVRAGSADLAPRARRSPTTTSTSKTTRTTARGGDPRKVPHLGFIALLVLVAKGWLHWMLLLLLKMVLDQGFKASRRSFLEH